VENIIVMIYCNVLFTLIITFLITYYVSMRRILRTVNVIRFDYFQ